MAETNEANQLSIGDTAPDFTLASHNEGELNLAWYRDRKHVLLAFYPGDWTPVCSNQIPGYQAELKKFEQHECQILAISVDSVPCHRAWAQSLGGIDYPLMSDYYPHGQVARRYRVFNERRGYAERSVFLIDKEGVIRFIQHNDFSELPDTAELFRELEHLNKQSV